MSLALSIRSEKAYQRFLLPAVNNSEHTISLNKETFGIDEDLEIQLEVLDNSWAFLFSSKYLIEDAQTRAGVFERKLHDNDVFMLTLPSGEFLNIVVNETDNLVHSYVKYDILNIDFLSIGNHSANDIQYSNMGLVSREHAMIWHEGENYVIEDTSANGVFINNKRIRGKRILEFGDFINIFGLNIVFLGTLIAINEHEENVIVNTEKIRPYGIYEIEDDEKKENVSEAVTFHRSPRQIFKLSTEPVEIEAPPQPKRKRITDHTL